MMGAAETGFRRAEEEPVLRDAAAGKADIAAHQVRIPVLADPALFDEAVTDRMEQESPDEMEPCLTAGRCRPVFWATTRSWRCNHCSAKLVLMKEVKDAG